MRVICAWCKRVMHEGDALTPITHGICAGCKRIEDDRITQMELERDAVR